MNKNYQMSDAAATGLAVPESVTLAMAELAVDVQEGLPARASGITGLTPHGLRHTAASLGIASGADVKVVQQMLGHASATMTLDLYGHLYGDRLDEVADRMDAVRTARRVQPTAGDLIKLPSATQSRSRA